MNLIRFLSSGSRGLTKGAPELGRYRLPDGRLIPDFSSSKNPFNHKDLPSRAETSPAIGVTAKAASTQAALPSSVPFPQAVRAKAGRGVAGILAALGGLLTRVRSLGLRLLQSVKGIPARLIGRLPRGRNRATATASSTRPVERPVQGELSLENVRVVRNDLTDTDYEVVCAETSTASPVKRVPKVTPAPVKHGALGRLAERLFSQKAH